MSINSFNFNSASMVEAWLKPFKLETVYDLHDALSIPGASSSVTIYSYFYLSLLNPAIPDSLHFVFRPLSDLPLMPLRLAIIYFYFIFKELSHLTFNSVRKLS